MHEEKRKNNVIWYKCNDFMFRVKTIDEESAVIWLNYHFKNPAFSMVMRDFLNRMEEYGISIKVNNIWNKHRGFDDKNTDVKLLIGESINFCAENDVESMVSKDIYLRDEWYE